MPKEVIVVGAFLGAAVICLPLALYWSAHALVHITEEGEKVVGDGSRLTVAFLRPEHFTPTGLRYRNRSIAVGLVPLIVALVAAVWAF